MSKKPPKPAPTLEEALGKLTADEKMTELAKGITVTDVYGFIQKDERKRISKFVFERFYRRYIMPFEKVCREYNSGFAQMAACCLMIEAMESFRHGWNDTMKDAKKPDGSRKYGGEIFEEFFSRYDEFKEFRGLGNEFYSSIRCGILHQAETQNGWSILREDKLYDDTNRSINSTIFRRWMKKCLNKYCEELEVAKDGSELWKKFKDKMAFVIQNCHRGNMKS
jgi:hypothetical protein